MTRIICDRHLLEHSAAFLRDWPPWIVIVYPENRQNFTLWGWGSGLASIEASVVASKRPPLSQYAVKCILRGWPDSPRLNHHPVPHKGSKTGLLSRPPLKKAGGRRPPLERLLVCLGPGLYRLDNPRPGSDMWWSPHSRPSKAERGGRLST